MNTTIKKMALALTVCTALCGATLAAPKGGNVPRAPQKATSHQQAPVPRAVAKADPSHGKHAPKPTPAPKHREQTRRVAHHTPPPPLAPAPRQPAPPAPRGGLVAALLNIIL